MIPEVGQHICPVAGELTAFSILVTEDASRRMHAVPDSISHDRAHALAGRNAPHILRRSGIGRVRFGICIGMASLVLRAG